MVVIGDSLRRFYTGLILDIDTTEHFKGKVLIALSKQAPNYGKWGADEGQEEGYIT